MNGKKIPGDRSKQPVYIRLKSQKAVRTGRGYGRYGRRMGWRSRSAPAPLLHVHRTRRWRKFIIDMPVILPQEAYAEWLTPDERSRDALQPLLVPYADEEMEAYPVSRFVNRPTNDSPECIAPF